MLYSILKQIGGGEFASGIPNIGLGVADVRDAAEAHIVAAYKEGVTGRHILSGWNTSYSELAATLRKTYPQYPIPTRNLPKILLWLIGPYVASLSRRFVSRHLDIEINLDNSSKSKKELGIEYTPLESTLYDMLEQMIESGHVR
mmetsp:Transcript_18489/g.52861  ORF Transcript_18489/g.52861 Transcript_18489/m.52861 type:complete len:144 (+) Transcript_18489:1258-1689(+)